MTFDIIIPAGVMEKLEKSIKNKLAKVVENVGLQVYNTIVLGHMTGVDSPYYSGSYISSWNISKGIPRAQYNKPTGIPNTYQVPGPKLDLGGLKFGQKVFISNAAPHAKQVEYEGTPTHTGGWMVATHAKNQVVMTYKFKLS